MSWTNPTTLADGFWDSAAYNRDVPDNLDFLYDGYGVWVPGITQTMGSNITVSTGHVLMVPAYTKSTVTVTKLGWRRSSAGGQIDVGIYTDDDNDETASVVITSGLRASPSTSGVHAESLAFSAPATLSRGIKYWLAFGSNSNNNAISGNNGPVVTLGRKAVNSIPLPNVITFNSPYPPVIPALAALP